MNGESRRDKPGDASGGAGRPPRSPASTPRDLKVKLADQKLLIDWSDGHHSAFALAQLRRVCPCATCRTEREKRSANPLKILKADPSGLRVVSAKLVGNYAIQLIWSDGHDTGIFDFRFLRSLDAR
jgi:DUF971 family protein